MVVTTSDFMDKTICLYDMSIHGHDQPALQAYYICWLLDTGYPTTQFLVWKFVCSNAMQLGGHFSWLSQRGSIIVSGWLWFRSSVLYAMVSFPVLWVFFSWCELRLFFPMCLLTQPQRILHYPPAPKQRIPNGVFNQYYRLLSTIIIIINH